MNSPKVSIITPCLNSESTIRQTIESVLNQTYKNIEYIIIDGKSTDKTLDIIREYIPLFGGRLHYISEKDHGIYDAMNKGIKVSTGSLIGIINSDDFYEYNAVENIVNNMVDREYQVIYGYCRTISKDGKIGIIKTEYKKLNQSMIPHPTCFVLRKVYQDFGMFLNIFKIAGDYEFMVRLYNKNQVIFTQVKTIIANFRLGGACSNLKKANLEVTMIKYHYHLISLKDFAMSLVNIYIMKDFG